MDYQTFNSHGAPFGGQFAASPPSQPPPPPAAFAYGQFPSGAGLGGALGSSVLAPGMPQNPRGKPARPVTEERCGAPCAAWRD